MFGVYCSYVASVAMAHLYNITLLCSPINQFIDIMFTD